MDFIPHTDNDRTAMLDAIGVSSMEDLLGGIPASLRATAAPDIADGVSESEVLAELRRLADQNADTSRSVSFLGAGAYEHLIPSAVWNLASRGEFATSYTPYQAEASQGTLQAIFEYQSILCELTGLDVANASMYDGASATAEAVLVALRATGRQSVVVSRGLHPEYRQVTDAYLGGLQRETSIVPWTATGNIDLDELHNTVDEHTAAVVVQTPNVLGVIESIQPVVEAAHAVGALCIVVANPVALGLIEAPGHLGADLVVGEAQPLGIPLGYGGPYAGYFTATRALMRKIPGRIAGLTKDVEGRRGYVLTLQAREQHIRRERATSNICTNQALCALAVTIHTSLLGQQGLQEVARLNVWKSQYARQQWTQIPGVELAFSGPTFNEFVLRMPQKHADVQQAMQDAQMIGGLPLGRWYDALEDCSLWCVTEARSRDDIDRATNVIRSVVGS